MNRTALVTGAQGFLGKAVVRRLSEAGWTVVATGRRPQADPLPAHRFEICDLANRDAVAALIEPGIDVVVHAAACIRADREDVFERDNVLATANVCDAARASNCRGIVYCSTISVYAGDGPYAETSANTTRGAYATSKLAAETLVENSAKSGLPGTILRFAGLHGPGRRSGVVAGFARAALSSHSLVVREPKTRMRFAFVDEAADAIRLAVDDDRLEGCRCYNVGGSECLTLRELATRIVELSNSDSAITEQDTAVVRDREMSIDLIREELGYSPQSLRDNLLTTVDYWRARAHEWA